ncbi:uncharacterized protein HaLaN_28910 [Haematococcus lacustris]|uniref:Uncharacterized protein n=1 Tax=Haematococcus lacustris TaxID=44745 RepID=A0A6A0AB81_HAELA|nr:uncharacterized protein HaLaN_28910 [Haematococcus lacustris]
MADGTATGLVSAAELQKETARLRAEQEERRRAAEGGGAETVYRDRATGRVVSREEAAASRQALGRDGKPLPRAKTAEEVAAEQHLEWRGGLAQQQAARERAAAMVAEVSGASPLPPPPCTALAAPQPGPPG